MVWLTSLLVALVSAGDASGIVSLLDVVGSTGDASGTSVDAIGLPTDSVDEIVSVDVLSPLTVTVEKMVSGPLIGRVVTIVVAALVSTGETSVDCVGDAGLLTETVEMLVIVDVLDPPTTTVDRTVSVDVPTDTGPA